MLHKPFDMTNFAMSVCFDELRRKNKKTAAVKLQANCDLLVCFGSLDRIATIFFNRISDHSGTPLYVDTASEGSRSCRRPATPHPRSVAYAPLRCPDTTAGPTASR